MIAALRRISQRVHHYVYGPADGWVSHEHMTARLDDLQRSSDDLRRRARQFTAKAERE